MWFLLFLFACSPTEKLPPVLSPDPDTDTELTADTDLPPDTDLPADTDLAGPCTVCFTWHAPATLPLPTVTTREVCNDNGLTAGLCPGDAVCGAPRTRRRFDGEVVSSPKCEPVGGVVEQVLDLGEVLLETGEDVELRLTQGGAAWPRGAADSAGFLVLTEPTLRLATRVRLPTNGATTRTFRLPVGVWHVTHDRTAAWQPWVYGTFAVPGTLTVSGPGVWNLDMPTRPVELILRLDGNNVLAAEDRTVIFDNGYTTLAFWDLPPGGQLQLPVGVWHVLHQYDWGNLGESAPLGPALHDTEVSALTTKLILDSKSLIASGVVTIDGAPPAANQQVYLDLVRQDGQALASRPVDADGRFSFRVPQGTFDVFLRTQGGVYPLGGTLVERAWTATDTWVSWSATTARAHGELRSGGQALRNTANTNANVRFVYADGGRSELALSDAGPLAFDGVVWSGTADVWVDGTAAGLPSVPALILPQADVTQELALELAPARVSVRVLRDGQRVLTPSPWMIYAFPLDAPGGLELPDPILTDPGRKPNRPIRVAGGTGGAATLRLAPGPWRLAMLQERTNGGLPVSWPELGDIDVTGDMEVEFDLPTITYNLELQRDGLPLDLAPGGTRGWIEAFGAQQVDLPLQGPAQVQMVGLGDTEGLGWRCVAPCVDPEILTLLANDIGP